MAFLKMICIKKLRDPSWKIFGKIADGEEKHRDCQLSVKDYNESVAKTQNTDFEVSVGPPT